MRVASACQPVYVDGTSLDSILQHDTGRCRTYAQGDGPALVEASVVRIDPHSSSDDHRKYRDQADLQSVSERDPILRTEQYILQHELLAPDEIAALRAEIKTEVDGAADKADAQPAPSVAKVMDHIYAAVTWGATVITRLNSRRQMKPEGRSLEIIDLRTLVPLDAELIYRSVRKTSRVIILHEDSLTWALARNRGSHPEHCIDALDAPVLESRPGIPLCQMRRNRGSRTATELKIYAGCRASDRILTQSQLPVEGRSGAARHASSSVSLPASLPALALVNETAIKYQSLR